MATILRCGSEKRWISRFDCGLRMLNSSVVFSFQKNKRLKKVTRIRKRFRFRLAGGVR